MLLFWGSWSWLDSLAFLPTVWIQEWDTHTHTCVYLPSYPHTHMHTVICSPTQERTEWADLCAVLVSQQLHMTVQRKARGAACQANGLVWAGEGEACWEKKAMEGQKCNLLLDIRAWPPSWRGLSGWGETGRQFHVCPLEWRPRKDHIWGRGCRQG